MFSHFTILNGLWCHPQPHTKLFLHNKDIISLKGLWTSKWEYVQWWKPPLEKEVDCQDSCIRVCRYGLWVLGRKAPQILTLLKEDLWITQAIQQLRFGGSHKVLKQNTKNDNNERRNACQRVRSLMWQS
jgi:hypothetical protein